MFVCFSRFGIETKWVVECKCWRTNVPQEKVFALKTIVEDVGADRGVIISAKGFQKGAILAAQNTNISLLTLDQLKDIAKKDLIDFALRNLQTAIDRQRQTILGFVEISKEKKSRFIYAWSERAPDGVYRMLGIISFLEYGMQKVRLCQPPYPTGPSSDGGRRYRPPSSEEDFLSEANDRRNRLFYKGTSGFLMFSLYENQWDIIGQGSSSFGNHPLLTKSHRCPL